MTQPLYPHQSLRFADTPLFAGLPGDIKVSFEFFPPKSEAGEAAVLEAVRSVAQLAPDFVSLTYGAGGSTKERSWSLAGRMRSEVEVPVAAHLTCVGASKDETHRVAEEFWNAGIRHIVALRGDAGQPGAKFEPHPQGYASAAELVEGLKARFPFEISVAAYPEVHPDAVSAEADIDNLKRKLDAGADRAITQFFFSADTFFRFRDRAAAAGIDKSIVPGVLPISNLARTKSFAAACGAELPEWLEHVFDGLDDHPRTRELVAATVTAEFCRRLYAEQVREFHFYTLNRAELSYATCHLLGLRPKRGAAGMEQAA
ncbi:MAG: methylenetetrahydrofolate reductase [NAD(P)H] [Sphingomonadales bacterium]|nr:methylenetetrahydrofolate reductase [NAD(P)H] [Sphingomonadales bacterium]MBD3772701.1 methylenetetrahydrofolate reductase [NAD(P)H] [Paracoccaceae bacterium]